LTVADDVLIGKVKAGDQAAFEGLVKRYERQIYNLAYRVMGNKEDASDVLQETFIQAFRKLGTFKGNSSFSTWLYRIAMNQCLMKKRRSKIMRTVSLDKPIEKHGEEDIKREFADDWTRSPAATLDNKVLKERLEKAIGLLPADYRAAFILRDMNNLSNEDAAKVLKISVPAVKSRLHRARMFLRDRVSEYFQGQGRQR
jgi:RNA polymerase sigma-70 factor, ECF subfamily